jgi:prepilin-type N-terminal cleavage/methylation domain-containing protein
MPTKPNRRFARGTTLVELMIAVTILAVVMAGTTKVVIDLYKTQRVRNLGARLQGQGRDALGRVEHQLRAASMGAPVGVIWAQDQLGNVVRRPAVQIFDNVSAFAAAFPVKAGTDALLVVGAAGLAGEAATVGVSFDSTTPLQVTDATPFATPFVVGTSVLVGPYKSAAWTAVTAVNVGPPVLLTLGSTQNVFPGGRAESGSMVRPAHAFLYYVSATDELVEQELLVPRAPSTMAQGGERHILARGLENLQIDCETDNGVALQPCPGVLPDTDPIAVEAAWALGVWGTGGPRLNEATISTLRTVTLSVILRSEQPMIGSGGDAAILLEGTTLTAGGGVATDPYIRRAYRLPVAVRNVALGVL